MSTAYWNQALIDVEERIGLGPGLDLKSMVLAYERRLIEAALERTGRNQRRAARLLGILPTTLNEKLKRFGLRTDASRQGLEAGAADRPAGAETGREE